MGERQKRILLFVSNDVAGDNRVHKMASTLTKHGNAVLVVGRKLPQSLPLPEVTYQVRRLRFVFRRGAMFYAEMNLRYFLLLLFKRFDVATANDLDTLPAVYLATKIRRKQMVYDSHEYFTEVPELQSRPRVRRVWEAIERRIFPRLTRCMTVCESIAEEYRRRYSVPVSVVRNLPLRSLQPPPRKTLCLPSERVVLYQGAVNIGRGLELLVEAMQHVDACAVIVGDGDIMQRIKDLTDRHHVAHKIVFTGRVPFDEVPAYTQLATIGVSLEEDMGKNCRYVLPNKLFDYIQACKPVLVSDLPEMRKIVEQYDCGQIVRDRSPLALARQIQDLLDSTDSHNRYTLNCATAAEELCWERQEHTIMELYA